MEVFAGFGEHTDDEIGRLIQAIEDLGQLDNTLVFYEVGDNGASAEGSMNGLFNEMTYFNGVPETVVEVLKHIDDLGGPNSYGTMRPAGRSRVMRRSPGRSRSPAATAAPAIRWSSTGPRESRPRARCGRSGITSSTSRRPSSKPPDCLSPRA